MIAGHFLLLPAVPETGLLEQAVLLIAETDAAGKRYLLAPSGEPIGFAHWRRPGPWWLPWRRRLLAVHEQDDEPLVFTVRRALSLTPSLQVQDADNEWVGSVTPPWLLDRWGRPAAELIPLAHGGGIFRTMQGEALADWMPGGSIVRLGLHQPAWADPFLKMLLLAATLHAPVPPTNGAG
jgi:hypothetical protein